MKIDLTKEEINVILSVFEKLKKQMGVNEHGETSYRGFFIGDTVRINKRPGAWSSLLKEKCPLDLEFPIDIRIDDIKEDVQHEPKYRYYAMSAGGYGWDLTHLIDTNLIEKL